MKLTKDDSMFLYGLLVHAKLSGNGLIDEDVDRIDDILHDLKTYVLSNTDDGDEGDEDETEEEVEKPEADDFITTDAANGLPSLTVISPTGKKVDLEFEDVGETDSVDVLVDSGTVIIDNVSHLKREDKKISVFDGDEWHDFEVPRFPKAWKKLDVSRIYGVSNESEEEE